MVKLSIKERRVQFQFFLGLFIVTTSLLSFGIFYSAKSRYAISKQDLERTISENQQFEEMVIETRPTIDTAFKQIIRFNPNVQAVFLKNDIQIALNSIKSAYERKASDYRYKTFIQASQLYNTLFFDRQELRGNLRDLEDVKRSLDDCVISRRQLQQTLQSR